MPTEKLTFESGGHTLAGRLDLPEGPVRAAALFAHCFTCSKDIPAARRIAARLAAAGIATLRFDFTGLGHSGGEFANTSFTSNVADLEAAAAAMAARDLPVQLMVGHSLGGAAVLRAAPKVATVRAVVTIGAPADPAHVTHHFSDALPTILADGSADVSIGGRPFRIGRAFVEDIGEAKLTASLGRMRAALLVLHAPLDEIVGIDNASQIFLAARHPKSFVTLDGADHLVSRPVDAEYVAEVIGSWSARYLDLAPEPERDGAPEGVVRVSEAEPDGFLQDIQHGPSHHLVADEPASVGGTDRGPTPYGLVAAALGACTSMTVRLYARRKKWPLDHVAVDVTHDKRHADDAASDGPARADHFERRIALSGELTEDQRQRLLEIAERCPVHRTLEGGARITTCLA